MLHPRSGSLWARTLEPSRLYIYLPITYHAILYYYSVLCPRHMVPLYSTLSPSIQYSLYMTPVYCTLCIRSSLVVYSTLVCMWSSCIVPYLLWYIYVTCSAVYSDPYIQTLYYLSSTRPCPLHILGLVISWLEPCWNHVLIVCDSSCRSSSSPPAVYTYLPAMSIPPVYII